MDAPNIQASAAIPDQNPSERGSRFAPVRSKNKPHPTIIRKGTPHNPKTGPARSILKTAANSFKGLNWVKFGSAIEPKSGGSDKSSNSIRYGLTHVAKCA